MIKSSNKKDIHILKIQGNNKYCKQHGGSNCEDCYIFCSISTNNTHKKLILKKQRVSCHNLFLLGKRKSTRHLTLQEDHNVSVYGLFFILGQWAQILKSAPRPPQKVKLLVCFY